MKYGFATTTILATIYACASQSTVETDSKTYRQETLIVTCDPHTGKSPLRKAIEKHKAEIIYDYNIICGMAIRTPANVSSDELIEMLKKVEGVASVEYDRKLQLHDNIQNSIY